MIGGQATVKTLQRVNGQVALSRATRALRWNVRRTVEPYPARLLRLGCSPVWFVPHLSPRCELSPARSFRGRSGRSATGRSRTKSLTADHVAALVCCRQLGLGVMGLVGNRGLSRTCPCRASCRGESWQVRSALSRSARVWGGLAFAPDAISHLRLCMLGWW